MPETPDLIGSLEACHLLGIDRSTLSTWVNHRNPKIRPAMQLPGLRGAFLFNRADVLALVNAEAEAEDVAS